MNNPDRVTYFAATDSRGKRVPFGLKAVDRTKHMYVIGKTGMGKSTLLENMAIQDIQNGEGLAFIDPHGGTADKLLEYIPENRINDVVYFAPFDLDQPIAFNVMEDVGYDKRHLVTSGLMATFKKIWQDAWSARMEYILTNTLLALLEYPGATLLGVNRMYTDKAYRKKVVDNIKDPVVKDFWTKEFAQYTDRFTQEATPAIQNKVGQFTSNPLIRNIIGQPESSFDIRKLMDERKILIVNLSKGLVGDTNTQLLGSMITTRIFLAAMSRADLSARDISELPNFYFYVDEFQNFANETFAEILSEARKYKLNLTIAHQYVEQMEEEVRAAVFGNVGTTVAFRVGPFDAEVLETIFLPEFNQEDLVNLGMYQMYLTLMIDGVGSRPFSAVSLPPIEPPPTGFKQRVIEASRVAFGTPRSSVEKEIFDELAPRDEMPEPKQKAPKREPPRGGPPPRQGNANRAPAGNPGQKSAGELKDILRGMTANNDKKEISKEKQQQAPLKGALAEVLKKSEGSTPAAKPKETSKQHAPQKPAQRQDPKRQSSNASDSRQDTRQNDTPKSDTNRPYEVPEETLRNIFSDKK